MNVFPPKPQEYARFTELPVEAPKPRMWKLLGHVDVNIEAQYGLASWGDELDIDREAELIGEMVSIARSLQANGVDLSDDGIVLVRHSRPQLLVRFIPCMQAVFATVTWAVN